MAHVSGTANSFADLKTSFENACVANGWTLADGILYKGNIYIKFTAATAYLRMDCGTGKSGSSLTGGHTHGVMMHSPTQNPITFPVNYEAHIFTDPDEVYLVMNYNTEYYQHLNFGQSDVPGITGSGIWFTGFARSDLNITSSTGHLVYMAIAASSGGTTSYDGSDCGLFTNGGAGSYLSSFLHCTLDGITSWRLQSQSVSTSVLGAFNWASPFMFSLPNDFNSGNVLIPVRALIGRSSNTSSIAAQMKNARYVRLDNLNSGDIITFGTDQWKVYPWHRRNAAQRNGLPWNTGASHTGTCGFAFRYTGV